jgi:hypothetical protein
MDVFSHKNCAVCNKSFIDDLENENSNSEVEQNDRKKKIKKVETEVETLLEML